MKIAPAATPASARKTSNDPRPDGLTLLVAPDSTFTANPALFSKLIYDPNDFTPISVLCRGTPMLIVNPSLPVKTVPELIAYAKANPGKLSYGSFGTGTYAHLSMEEFKRRTGIDMQHVPYRGAAPALTGLLGNEVSVMLLNLSSVEADAAGRAGQADRGSDRKAIPKLPDLPTDCRVGAGLQDVGLVRTVGPGQHAAELLARVHDDVAKALDLPGDQTILSDQ